MKKIKEINQEYGKVYVFLKEQEIGAKFLTEAENEGYTFGDGVKPTERPYSNIMVINGDMTINYPGTNGRIAFQCNATGTALIDYEKVINESEDILYKQGSSED